MGEREFDRERQAERKLAHQTWLDALRAQPYRHDFYETLRRIDAAHPELPRLGEALRPVDEPMRLAQSAELSFAPAALHQVETAIDGQLRLRQRIFGLLGPMGPLPLHFTETVRERSRNHADATLQRFLDLLTHRFALQFYRAWATAQPVLDLDRPADPAKLDRLASLLGLGLPSQRGVDALPDRAKLFFAGRLAGQIRDADGLQSWCRCEFRVPVRVEQWVGHWMPLARPERSRLSRRRGAGQSLGRDAVLGQSVWDVQHKFRIVIGPLDLGRYQSFLPGGRELAQLHAMVRQWHGLEFAWELQLVLRREQVPPLKLGRGRARLGLTSWLGHYRSPHDADQLHLKPERPQRAVTS